MSMTVGYQLNLLAYIVQAPDGNQYINDLDEDLFDLLEFKLALQLVKKYYKLYGTVPSEVMLKQFLEEQVASTPSLTKEIVKDLREVIEDMFYLLPESDRTKLQDTLILEIQQKHIDSAFMDFASGKMSVTQVLTRMNRLSSMVKSATIDQHSDGGFLVEDREKFMDEQIFGNPTFLHDLNRMTAAGGFYSPQLIVFLSGPKQFKTGIILKLGVEYARYGNKVYYADNENGARQIRNRAKMAVMECELHELFEPGIQEELNETLSRFGNVMGGDLFIDSYPAHSKSMQDVKNRLAYLKEEFNWAPNIIIYDIIDKFIPINKVDQGRDPRIAIQLVYDECINLNKELGTFAIVPSQVNRKAIGKKTFDVVDLAEDFAKSMNANSIFAICATPEEVEQGIRRIIPVAQREGTGYKGTNICVVNIDEKRMLVREVDKEEYLKNIKDD
jgi:hypothetical protein